MFGAKSFKSGDTSRLKAGKCGQEGDRVGRRLHWPDVVVGFHLQLKDNGQAEIEEVEDVFIDDVGGGWRESTNENESIFIFIFKENARRRHLGNNGARRLADGKEAKRCYNFSNRIMQGGGEQSGVGDEGGYAGVAERDSVQIEVPEQLLEKLLQNGGCIDRDKGLIVQDREKGSGTENRLESVKVNIISKIGGTGVGGDGCCARGWVDTMSAAEIFALRGCMGSGDRRFQANISSKGGVCRAR